MDSSLPISWNTELETCLVATRYHLILFRPNMKISKVALGLNDLIACFSMAFKCLHILIKENPTLYYERVHDYKFLQRRKNIKKDESKYCS